MSWCSSGNVTNFMLQSALKNVLLEPHLGYSFNCFNFDRDTVVLTNKEGCFTEVLNRSY